MSVETRADGQNADLFYFYRFFSNWLNLCFVRYLISTHALSDFSFFLLPLLFYTFLPLFIHSIYMPYPSIQATKSFTSCFLCRYIPLNLSLNNFFSLVPIFSFLPYPILFYFLLKSAYHYFPQPLWRDGVKTQLHYMCSSYNRGAWISYTTSLFGKSLNFQKVLSKKAVMDF